MQSREFHLIHQILLQYKNILINQSVKHAYTRWLKITCPTKQNAISRQPIVFFYQSLGFKWERFSKIESCQNVGLHI